MGRILVAAAVVVALAAGLWWFLRGAQPPRAVLPPDSDPRLAYQGPYQNIDPAVKYVADERCTSCHARIARTYAKHPMGRSLFPIAKAPTPPTDARHHNPFDSLGSQFSVVQVNGQTIHRRERRAPDGHVAATLDFPVRYVLGSGNHGYSYLTDHDGYLIETPISWYTQKQLWDKSPGFGESLLAGRIVMPACLFCHVNKANYVQGSVNHYHQPIFDGDSISCQRCHGPGELHVAARNAGEAPSGGIDYTIVNPRHLERATRESVCEQCHLVGRLRVLRAHRDWYDFRPGLPLERFLSAFVKVENKEGDAKAVGQVEQMYLSRCFKVSKGPNALGCISCHDPHEQVAPEQRVAHYRERCLNCHKDQGCKLPLVERQRQSSQDSCIDCHMSRYPSSDIPHQAATDHRILRFGRPVAGKEVKPTTPSILPVSSFYLDHSGARSSTADDRDSAVGLVRLYLLGEEDAAESLRFIRPALEQSAAEDPTDLDAAEALAFTLSRLNRKADALEAFEAILARAPERELVVIGAANNAEVLHQVERAIQYWQQAAQLNPWQPDYRRQLCPLLIKKERWAEALKQADDWIRLDPFSVEARTARIWSLLGLDKKEEARAEFHRMEALTPPNLKELTLRFEPRLR
jgi:hypothetical protein